MSGAEQQQHQHHVGIPPESRDGSKLDSSNLSFNVSRLHPSDSGYGDSPGSVNTSALRFGYEGERDEPEPTISGAAEEITFGFDDVMTDEDDDDVFMDYSASDNVQDQADTFDGPEDESQNRGRHASSENSHPIDIPLTVDLPLPMNSMAMATPPRFYGSEVHRRPDESMASSWVISGVLDSPGRWSVMATRFNSPAGSLRSLWGTSNPVSASANTRDPVPDRRPRFFSEGSALHGNDEPTVDQEPPAVGPTLRRDRSRSEPAIQNEVHRMFGQELRRISDEFHQSYQTLHEIGRQIDARENGRSNGRNNGVLHASSYPGSFRRRRGSWWQRVIQFVSPPSLDPVPPSPGVSPPHDENNGSSSSPFSSSSQSSTQTVRTSQRPNSSSETEDTSLDDVDGFAAENVLFQLEDEENDEDISETH